MTSFVGFAVGAPESVTFHDDIEAVLQNHCQGCHRPGEIGPMPLLTYQNVRPWAKALKEAVLTRKMPPWFADSTLQHYRNDASLSSADIAKLTSWVAAGAPEGDPKDAPSPQGFVEGWSIGQPDLIVEMPASQVPAKGTIEYNCRQVMKHLVVCLCCQLLRFRLPRRIHRGGLNSRQLQ